MRREGESLIINPMGTFRLRPSARWTKAAKPEPYHARMGIAVREKVCYGLVRMGGSMPEGIAVRERSTVREQDARTGVYRSGKMGRIEPRKHIRLGKGISDITLFPKEKGMGGQARADIREEKI